jgi:hypothetical protein
MKPTDQFNDNDNQPSQRRGNLELFFVERIGNRSFLRFTRLGVILILCFTVLPLIAIFTIFLFQSNPSSLEQINANVPMTERPQINLNQNITKQVPPLPSPPKVRMQPLPPAPTPPALPPEYDRNMNEEVQKSPSPTPVKPSIRNSNEK